MYKRQVFVSTVLVSTITALAILSTGTWSSGLTSVTLTITAFQSVFGQAGLDVYKRQLLTGGLHGTQGLSENQTEIAEYEKFGTDGQ